MQLVCEQSAAFPTLSSLQSPFSLKIAFIEAINMSGNQRNDSKASESRDQAKKTDQAALLAQQRDQVRLYMTWRLSEMNNRMGGSARHANVLPSQISLRLSLPISLLSLRPEISFQTQLKSHRAKEAEASKATKAAKLLAASSPKTKHTVSDSYYTCYVFKLRLI